MILGAAGATVTLGGTGALTETIYCNAVRKFWRWHNLTIDGDRGGGNYTYFGVHIFNGATDWTFSQFHVKNTTKSGYQTDRVFSPYNPYGGHFFMDCLATHVGRGGGGDHGWYAAATDIQIWYCQAIGGSGISLGFGITMHSSGVTDGTDNSSINYCLAHGFTELFKAGFAAQEGSNLRVVGCISHTNRDGYQIGINASSVLAEWNLAYDNLQHGFYVGPLNSTDVDFVNNTSYGNTQRGLYIHSSGTNTYWDNNILYSNGTNLFDNSASTTDGGHNLVGVDPSFVNAGTKDFHLQSSSSAIDGGASQTSVGAVAYDLDGVAIDGNWPQGCFEYSETPPVAATPPTVSINAMYTGPVGVTFGLSNVSVAGQGDTVSKVTINTISSTLVLTINQGGGAATIKGGS